MMTRLNALTLVTLFLALPRAIAGEAIEPKYWKEIPEQAGIMSATFIGGKGTEWLCSGGFQADGTVIAVGNVLGPVFDLGKPATVIGSDLAPPAEPKRVPKMSGGKDSKQELDKKTNEPLWVKPSWRHDATTGFVLRLSPDMKQILSVARMPWNSGALTSAIIGKDGAIYIAGRATDKIGSLSANTIELKSEADAQRKSGNCDHTFIAKLSPDALKCEWLRHARGFSDAPKLSMQQDGSIQFAAQDLKKFDASGKLIGTILIPGGVSNTTSVSPIDGSIVKGGEHHWPTGREPYRCPTLSILQPDGTLKFQFYDWGGPYVGLDNCRQVSDSAIRAVTHDKDGNIFAYAWSDGGNSVMTTEPTDVRKSVGPKGLGINSAGAGVLSCAYLIKIEPKNFTTIGWTMWLAFDSGNRNKPNSIWIDTLGYADDGSVIFGGRSAFGLWQTKNKFENNHQSGSYIAVLNPDMSGVRFCSGIPGTGAVTVGNDERAGWGVASGTVLGKTRALFFSGAVAEEELYGSKHKAPTKNALQENFNGGLSDGYMVMLDLSAGNVTHSNQVAATAPAEPQPTRASFEKGAPGRSEKKGNVPTLPTDGTVFHFSPTYPKWVTVDAEIRDRAGKLWPSFLSGKPVDGTFTFKAVQPEAGFSVACATAAQNKGDQSRRVLGELIKNDQAPKFELKITSFSALKNAEFETLDNKGNKKKRTVDYYDAKGTLEIGAKKIEVAPRITLNFQTPKDRGIDGVQMNAFLTLKGSELGLTAPGTEGEIDIRIGMSGTTQAGAPAKEKK